MPYFPGPLAPSLKSRLIPKIPLPGLSRESSAVVVSLITDTPQSDDSGGLCTALTHGRGVSWTDLHGEKLARMAIESGGEDVLLQERHGCCGLPTQAAGGGCTMNAIPPFPPFPQAESDAPHTQLRLALRNNGYKPVPVVTATKAPRLTEWPQICAGATDDDIRTWQLTLGDCESTGILCGEVVGVDIDCLTGAAVEELALAAQKHFGATPLHRVGKAPKVLHLYQADGLFRKRLTPAFQMQDGTRAKVEILACGQQFVAFGIHPDTGQPYRWLGETPETVPAADLPVLREQDIAAFLRECEAVFLNHGGQALSIRSTPPKSAETTASSYSGPRAPNEELIARIKSNVSWHENMLTLIARWVSDGESDQSILSWAEELTTVGYTVEQTEKEMQTMINGARSKGYDRGHAKSDSPFGPFPAQNIELLKGSPPPFGLRQPIAERFRFPADCGSVRRGYLIKHVVAPGDLAAIIGSPGAGKSIFAPHLGYAVAQGRSVFSLRVRQGRVLYVTAEDATGMAQRVEALRQRHGDTEDFALCSYDNFADGNGFEQLYEDVVEWKPALVFIDTLAVAWSGIKENESDDMGKIIKHAKRLTALGCAVVIIHHPAKHGDITIPRGHSCLHGALDLTIGFEKDAYGIIRGRMGKNRNGTSERTFAFKLAVHPLGVDEDGDLVATPVAEELISGEGVRAVPLSAMKQRMLDILISMCAGRDSVSEGDWMAECSKQRVATSESEKDRLTVLRKAYRNMVEHGHIVAPDGNVRPSRLRGGQPSETAINWAKPSATTFKPISGNLETEETTPLRVVPGSVAALPALDNSQAAALPLHSSLDTGAFAISLTRPPAADGGGALYPQFTPPLTSDGSKQGGAYPPPPRSPKADQGAFAAGSEGGAVKPAGPYLAPDQVDLQGWPN